MIFLSEIISGPTSVEFGVSLPWLIFDVSAVLAITFTVVWFIRKKKSN